MRWQYGNRLMPRNHLISRFSAFVLSPVISRSSSPPFCNKPSSPAYAMGDLSNFPAFSIKSSCNRHPRTLRLSPPPTRHGRLAVQIPAAFKGPEQTNYLQELNSAGQSDSCAMPTNSRMGGNSIRNPPAWPELAVKSARSLAEAGDFLHRQLRNPFVPQAVNGDDIIYTICKVQPTVGRMQVAQMAASSVTIGVTASGIFGWTCEI